MTPQEALDRIAALCDEYEEHGAAVPRYKVRAVLVEVSPEAGGVLDRDQARAVLVGYHQRQDIGMSQALDRLAGCVRPAAVDRDALMEVLRKTVAAPANENWVWNTANAILALVRPVAADDDEWRVM